MNSMTKAKLKQLKGIISKYKKVCIGFSGGVDSTLLLALIDPETEVVAVTADGKQVKRNTINFTKEFAKSLKNTTHILQPIDFLAIPEFLENTKERCYVCKKGMFETIKQVALQNGCSVVFDGTNLDDLSEDRPGLKAIDELEIVSPFAQVGLTKDEIYEISKELNLPNKDLPADSCLATRIPFDEEITEEKLDKIEKAEIFLKSLGFSDFRVRVRDGRKARIEVKNHDLTRLKESQDQIQDYFKSLSLEMT